MKKFPDSAWVVKYAENSNWDRLYIEDHSFPLLGQIHYCDRSWGPQEYINYRIDILKRMAEDLQKIVKLFEVSDAHNNDVPLLDASKILTLHGDSNVH